MHANKFSLEIMQNTRRSVTYGNDDEEEDSHELASLLLKLTATGGDDSLGIAPI
jgi:hypothetical protein